MFLEIMGHQGKVMPAHNPLSGQYISPALRQAAVDKRHNMTEAEKRLWKFLRSNRLSGWHFRRQQIIDSYIVDFYCHAARLVVEVDGEIHQTQLEYDREREASLSQMGYRILRFGNHEVFENIEKVLAMILENLSPNPLPETGRGPGG